MTYLGVPVDLTTLLRLLERSLNYSDERKHDL